MLYYYLRYDDALNYIWPVGQAVKTPPSHGGNRGSSPLRVTTSEQVALVPIFLYKKSVTRFAIPPFS